MWKSERHSVLYLIRKNDVLYNGPGIKPCVHLLSSEDLCSDLFICSQTHLSVMSSAEVSQHALCLCVSDLLDDGLHPHHHTGNVIGSHSGLEVDDPALRHPQYPPHLPLQGKTSSPPVCLHLSLFTCLCSPVCLRLSVLTCVLTCLSSPVCPQL